MSSYSFFRNPKKFLLLAHPTGSTIPIGTHNWEVGSKAAVCDKRKEDLHELTFSICYPDKYTCNDGSCIALGDRCNTEIDCADKSDENTCDYLKYGRNYAKELIPRDRNGTPVDVFVNVSILAFPGIYTDHKKLNT